MDSSFSFFRENSGEDSCQHLALGTVAPLKDTHLLADLGIDEDDVVQSQDDFGDALCSSVLPGDAGSDKAFHFVPEMNKYVVTSSPLT